MLETINHKCNKILRIKTTSSMKCLCQKVRIGEIIRAHNVLILHGTDQTRLTGPNGQAIMLNKETLVRITCSSFRDRLKEGHHRRDWYHLLKLTDVIFRVYRIMKRIKYRSSHRNQKLFGLQVGAGRLIGKYNNKNHSSNK